MVQDDQSELKNKSTEEQNQPKSANEEANKNSTVSEEYPTQDDKTQVDLQNDSKNEKKEGEVEFKFKSDVTNLDLRNLVMNSYLKNRENPNLSEIVESLKKDLDEAFPKGWVVFGGKHMVGACSFIENTLVDFEVEGISFVLFQTIYPDDYEQQYYTE